MNHEPHGITLKLEGGDTFIYTFGTETKGPHSHILFMGRVEDSIEKDGPAGMTPREGAQHLIDELTAFLALTAVV